jgi:hypothetical protein
MEIDSSNQHGDPKVVKTANESCSPGKEANASST